jgi:transcriptional regulator with XRE-family HTH domain
MIDRSERPHIGRPRTLPDDWVLLQMRDAEGYTEAEIASNYGVTPQAVSKRFKKMGHPSRSSFRDVLPWQITSKHHALYAAQRLKAHIKERRGEELSDTARKRLRDWRERLRRDGVVLDYRQLDIGDPWQYVPRTEADNRLVIRWPADAEPPTEDQRKLLELPTGT